MGRQHVGHSEIAAFAQDKVNLPKDKADEYGEHDKVWAAHAASR